jgi:hypothetical protein
MDPKQSSSPDESGAKGSASASENIRALAESSKQMFAAGQQLTENLSQLQQKAKRATDLRYQFSARPWLVPVIAVAGGFLG